MGHTAKTMAADAHVGDLVEILQGQTMASPVIIYIFFIFHVSNSI